MEKDTQEKESEEGLVTSGSWSLAKYIPYHFDDGSDALVGNTIKIINENGHIKITQQTHYLPILDDV